MSRNTQMNQGTSQSTWTSVAGRVAEHHQPPPSQGNPESSEGSWTDISETDPFQPRLNRPVRTASWWPPLSERPRQPSFSGAISRRLTNGARSAFKLARSATGSLLRAVARPAAKAYKRRQENRLLFHETLIAWYRQKPAPSHGTPEYDLWEEKLYELYEEAKYKRDTLRQWQKDGVLPPGGEDSSDDESLRQWLLEDEEQIRREEEEEPEPAR